MTTSSSVSAGTNLLSLPSELLAEVYDNLEFADLKSARLVCKLLEEIVNPDLFYTFTLYPHYDSVRELDQLCRSTRLASCVHEIYYNDVFRTYLESSLCEVDPATVEAVGKLDFHARMEKLSGLAIDYKTPTDLLELVLCLKKTLSRLPNLYRIVTLESNEWSRPLEIPAFYSRILGDTLYQYVQTHLADVSSREETAGTGSFPTILFSSHFSAKPIKCLELVTSSLGWLSQEVSLGKTVRCNLVLYALNELNLSCTSPLLELDYRYVRQLQALLKVATNLSSLTLLMGVIDKNSYLFENEGSIQYGRSQEDYDNLTFRAGLEWGPSPGYRPLEPRLTWSKKIKELKLGCLRCNGRELKQVLIHLSKSLDRLSLSDILILPTQQGYKKPRACLVQFIKWLQRRLRLKHVSFGGTLTNFGMQHWIVDGESQSGLHQRVAQFITKGGACPLDFVEIPSGHHDIGMPTAATIMLVGLHGKEYEGDPGWQMKYYDADGRPRDTGWPEEKLRLDSEDEGSEDEDEMEVDYLEDEDGYAYDSDYGYGDHDEMPYGYWADE